MIELQLRFNDVNSNYYFNGEVVVSKQSVSDIFFPAVFIMSMINSFADPSGRCHTLRIADLKDLNNYETNSFVRVIPQS